MAPKGKAAAKRAAKRPAAAPAAVAVVAAAAKPVAATVKASKKQKGGPAAGATKKGAPAATAPESRITGWPSAEELEQGQPVIARFNEDGEQILWPRLQDLLDSVLKHEVDIIEVDVGHAQTTSYIASKVHPGKRLEPHIIMPTQEFLKQCDTNTTAWPCLEPCLLTLRDTEKPKKKPKAPMEPLAVVGETDLFGYSGLEEASLLGISQPDPTAAALPTAAPRREELGRVGYCGGGLSVTR